MREKKITTMEFCKLTGIKRSTLEGYLKATSMIKSDNLIMICSKLNLSANYLLGLSNDKTLEKNNKVSDEKQPLNLFYNGSGDEEKLLKYYARLDEEQKDYIKGEMVRLYMETDAEKEKHIQHN